MDLTEENINQLLTLALHAAFDHDRDTALGYPGAITPLRVGMYFEAQGADGHLYVLDNEHLAKTGKVSVRQWVTGREAADGEFHLGGTDTDALGGGVKPGGQSGIGGVSAGALFTILGMATGSPALSAIGSALNASSSTPASSTKPTQDAISMLLQGLLKSKVARFGA